MTTIPDDITQNAKRALHLAIKDERVGFAIKVGMIGGAYEAFLAEIEAALMLERDRDRWQDINTAPKDGTRIILMWPAFSGLSEHVELGRWKDRQGWSNTYGHAFTGDPSRYMPLPSPPRAAQPSTPSDNPLPAEVQS